MSKGVTITTGEGAYASKVFVNGADEALTAMLIAEKYTTTKNGNLVAPAGLTVGDVGTVVSSFTAALAANKIATQTPASTKTDEFAFEVNVKDGKSYVHGIKEDSKWHKALIAAGATLTKTGDLKIPDGKVAVAFLEATLGKEKIEKYGSFKVNDLNTSTTPVANSPKPVDEKEFAFEVNVKGGKSYVHGIKEDSKWHKALIAAGATLTKTGDLKIPDGKVAATFLEDVLGKEKIEKYGGVKVNDLDVPLNEKEPTLSDYAARADEMAKTPEGAKILTETAADLVAIATRLSKAAQNYSVN